MCANLLVTCLRCLHFIWVTTEKYNVLWLPIAQERKTNPSWTQQHLSGNQRGKKMWKVPGKKIDSSDKMTLEIIHSCEGKLQDQHLTCSTKWSPFSHRTCPRGTCPGQNSVQDISFIILNRDQRKAVSGAWSSISSSLETAVADMHLCLHERSMKRSQPPDKLPSC